MKVLNSDSFVTGEDVGRSLGLTRAAIHKHVQALVARGVPIHRVPGRGYRLAEGVVLLDSDAVCRRLSAQSGAMLDRIDILEEVDSTSARLSRDAGPASTGSRVCLAETQTGGRGRRGRSWIATPYRDLMMSIRIDYPQWPARLQTLGLVAGLMIVRALEGIGGRGLKLKWPNDVVQDDRKLCGLLLDVTGEAHGACRMILGVGVNVSMEAERGSAIDRQWTDLETLTGRAPDRNVVAAACLNTLLPALYAFPETGFEPYRETWPALDALAGRDVAVHGADGRTVHGRADGIDESGCLRVIDESGGTRLFTQGDVSVRPR